MERNEAKEHALLVSGRDGYTVAVSIGEIDPAFEDWSCPATGMSAMSYGSKSSSRGRLGKLLHRGSRPELKPAARVRDIAPASRRLAYWDAVPNLADQVELSATVI
jgi:hypothetical protein